VTERICVAQIGAPHGVRGEVKLRSFTEQPEAFMSYGPLENEDGTRRFEIEALRPAKDHFVARFAGVGDRSAAEKLRIVMAAATVPDAELGAFLRREAVHEADLAEWRRLLEEAALASLGSPSSEMAKGKSASKRIRALEAELRRKDKALAETAALLILKKKVLAIWGDEADDTSPESDE